MVVTCDNHVTHPTVSDYSSEDRSPLFVVPRAARSRAGPTRDLGDEADSVSGGLYEGGAEGGQEEAHHRGEALLVLGS